MLGRVLWYATPAITAFDDVSEGLWSSFGRSGESSMMAMFRPGHDA